jgi:hypothetical protein
MGIEMTQKKSLPRFHDRDLIERIVYYAAKPPLPRFEIPTSSTIRVASIRPAFLATG